MLSALSGVESLSNHPFSVDVVLGSLLQQPSSKMIDKSIGMGPIRGGSLGARSLWRQRAGLIGGLLLLLLAAACSGGGSPAPTSTPPQSNPEVGAVVFTTDLAVGANRVVFGLIDRDGLPVRTQEAQVQALYLLPDQSTEEVRDTATARFMQWPTGQQGVFSTRIEFDTAGFWQLEVITTRDDGTPVRARGALQVKERAATPAIGDPAPRSSTPTLDDVSDLATISSANPPDPDLYRLSIDEALDAGKPLVVVFATPAFCVSATCGPQVEVISEVKERHQGQANFIHVEVFENPHLIQGGRPAGGVVPAVEEWGLPTEPWTFIIDNEGLVRAKFEQFTTAEEIEAALGEVP